MGDSHFSGMVYSQGAPLIPSLYARNVYWLDPTNGSDDNTGKSRAKAVKTLPNAYGLCTAGQHDTIFYIPGASSISLSALLTWSKAYTHLIGLGAPGLVGQRARIFQTAGNLDLSPLIDITADGCMFQNLYAFQGVDDAHSLINVRLTGDRNYFRNVHFAGGGHASNAIDGAASLQLSVARENFFEDCTLGVDTIAAATGVACLSYAAPGAGLNSTRNVFRNCRFTLWAGAAGAMFVEAMGDSGVDRYQLFENCSFINLSTTTLTTAFKFNSLVAQNKRFLLRNCAQIGATDWDADLTGMLFMDMPALTGATTSGHFTVST